MFSNPYSVHNVSNEMRRKFVKIHFSNTSEEPEFRLGCPAFQRNKFSDLFPNNKEKTRPRWMRLPLSLWCIFKPGGHCRLRELSPEEEEAVRNPK
ncbi:hypothetical protein CEXT_426151 [Caerostris extrusa]|uniref:Ycf15 n=1 Tax=Caerostris extrusa TaxID=172846 RepID=A0AAV4WWR6_CAEEX|nr:hypothetical protein CEXT_426151 [Caerostris extrusa]